MRVPTISLYNTSNAQLNTITNDLKDANEVVATQKQINSIADDPIGVTQVMDIDQSLKNLGQLDTNIDMGITWVNGVESSLRSVQDLLLETKLLCSQLANASVSASERADNVETVDGMIDQMLALGNAQVNGSYVFSGTQNNSPAFSYNDQSPSGVSYNGSDNAFFIQISGTTTMAVGQVGQEVFTENVIRVDSTNNTLFFREDPGMGLNSERVLKTTIPDGNHSPQELAALVGNAMNQASEESGYQVTYEVDYDPETNRFFIEGDGKTDGYFGFDLLWESGETPRVTNINTQGILTDSVDINVSNDKALIIPTPEPDGSAPIRLTYNDDGQWQILNDPGYGLPLEIGGSDTNLELDLDQDGIEDITVSLEDAAVPGDFIEFDIAEASSDTSIGPDLGFSGDVSCQPPHSDFPVALKRFDHTNNVIDFTEDAGSGSSSQLSAAIPIGDYADMGELAHAIEQAMEAASVNGIDYSVSYSENTHAFTIADSGGSLTSLELLWNSGTHAGTSAVAELGFDPTVDNSGAVGFTSDASVSLFTIIQGVNDTIDFKEIQADSASDRVNELTAVIAPGTYTDTDSFARAVEDALEDASEQYGNRVNYEVSYNTHTHGFTIKEDGETGKKLEEFDLLWASGKNVSTSAASVLGFEAQDVTAGPVKSENVSHGIFETLSALKEYLASDDVAGIQRTMTRLDTHYESITSALSDTGTKYNRLTITQDISSKTQLSLTERKSMIEDADIVESVMDLQAIQTAYEAALSATSKIMNLSLVDYL